MYCVDHDRWRSSPECGCQDFFPAFATAAETVNRLHGAPAIERRALA